MKIRAKTVSQSGFTEHFLGTIANDELNPIGELPAASFLEISDEEGDGVFLFYLDDNGEYINDSWFLTLEEAKHQALLEYHVDPEGWTEIPPADTRGHP